ncbi:MAG: hypothetical protein AB7S38_31095 [Vulcanimicrobiota bacterium]
MATTLPAQNESTELDLRIYQQNRELRAQNHKLQEELDLLGAKNVELIFSVGELESQVKTLEQKVADFDTRQQAIAEVTAQLEESRARTERAGAELAEMEENYRLSENMLGEQRELNLELAEQLEVAQARIEELEKSLLTLKQSYLHEEEPAPEHPQSPAERLIHLLEAELHSMSKSLVQQTLGRLDFSAETREPDAWKKILEELRFSAPRLAVNDQQGDRVRAILKGFETEMFAPAVNGKVNPEPAIALPSPAPVAEPVPAPTPTPMPVAVEAEPAPEPTPQPQATVEVEVAPAPEAQPEPEVAEVDFEERLAAAQTKIGEEALADFESLVELDPHDPRALKGYFASLVFCRHWEEALTVGRKMREEGECTPEFHEAMDTVLRNRLEETQAPVARKQLLIELGEHHLDEPRKALRFFRQADQITVKVPADGALAYHLCCLLEDSGEDRSRHLLAYMTNHQHPPELLEHVRQIFNHPRHRNAFPAVRTILTLARRPRAQAENVQRKVGGSVLASEPALIKPDETRDSDETRILNFCLQQLPQRASLEVPTTSPEFEARLEGSQPAPQSSRVTEIVLEAARTFRVATLRVRVKSGEPTFLIDGNQHPSPTVVYHQCLENLDLHELRFLIYGLLFQMMRGHLQVRRAAASLDDTTRARLINTCVDHYLAVGHILPEQLLLELRAGQNLRENTELLCSLTNHATFDDLRELCFQERPFAAVFDRLADRFASRASGLTAASFALVRDALEDGDQLKKLEQNGLGLLYCDQPQIDPGLLDRLQWLWADQLSA